MWDAIAREIKHRILSGQVDFSDCLLAQVIGVRALELYNANAWLRALANWQAEFDAYAVRYLRSELIGEAHEPNSQREG